MVLLPFVLVCLEISLLIRWVLDLCPPSMLLHVFLQLVWPSYYFHGQKIMVILLRTRTCLPNSGVLLWSLLLVDFLTLSFSHCLYIIVQYCKFERWNSLFMTFFCKRTGFEILLIPLWHWSMPNEPIPRCQICCWTIKMMQGLGIFKDRASFLPWCSPGG